LQISVTKWEWDFSDDFGYARISTANQDYAEPVETPQVEGVNKVCSGKIGGGRAGRPQFAKLMAALKAGDVVCVTKLDRPELAKLYCMAFAAGGRRLSSSGPNADVILSSPCSSQVCTSLKSAPHRYGWSCLTCFGEPTMFSSLSVGRPARLAGRPYLRNRLSELADAAIVDHLACGAASRG
jgi:Resolvase, N terminal domain